jgi:hypothetical protein
VDELAEDLPAPHRLSRYLAGDTMETVDDFRMRYARTDDDGLRALLAIEPCSLTPEAALALGEEAERRGLRSSVDPPRPDPLDSIDWPEISGPRKHAKASVFAGILERLRSRAL